MVEWGFRAQILSEVHHDEEANHQEQGQVEDGGVAEEHSEDFEEAAGEADKCHANQLDCNGAQDFANVFDSFCGFEIFRLQFVIVEEVATRDFSPVDLVYSVLLEVYFRCCRHLYLLLCESFNDYKYFSYNKTFSEKTFILK